MQILWPKENYLLLIHQMKRQGLVSAVPGACDGKSASDKAEKVPKLCDLGQTLNQSHRPFPRRIFHVEVSVKVTSIVRYSVISLDSCRISGWKR